MQGGEDEERGNTSKKYMESTVEKVAFDQVQVN